MAIRLRHYVCGQDGGPLLVYSVDFPDFVVFDPRNFTCVSQLLATCKAHRQHKLVFRAIAILYLEVGVIILLGYLIATINWWG